MGQEGEAEAEQPAEPWGAHPEAGEEPAPTEAAASLRNPAAGPRIWPRIVGVLLLFVIVGGVWIWQNPGSVYWSLRSWFPGSAGPDGTAAEIRTLDARVARLEQSLPPDLAALTQRVDALETRLPKAGQPAAPPAPPAADLRPLITRLDALEARVTSMAARAGAAPPAAATSPAAANQAADGPNVRSLAVRLDTLERQQAGEAADAARLEALQTQINALAAHNPPDLTGQLDAVAHRVGELAANQSKLVATSDRVARLAQVNAAEIALAAGRPLGAIPNAPPALARFANTAPPTEAGLRLAFATASQQALQVSLPDTEGKPFFDRILARLQDFRLITVREGDHVVIGNATAAILTHARVLLDVGDLSGATAAVATLSGPPAAKMAPWLADATALQAARQALASLAETG